MRPWYKPLLALAFVLVSALLIVLVPLGTLAAPATAPGTSVYLPVVQKMVPPTLTPTPTPTVTPTPTITPTPTGTPITSTVDVTVGPVIGFEMTIYSPMTVTIHAGDAVHWVWGSSGHTVTSGTNLAPDNQFCSPNNTDCNSTIAVTSNAGFTFDHQFLTAGTYNYFCRIHGPFGMTGAVVVLP